jgi:Ni/Co efflux regulator RcnB
MRKFLLIALGAATALSSPAVARDRHHHGDRHERHERHERRERHHWDRDRDRHHHHNRRIYVGYRLGPAYYGPRYIVTDYGRYHLRAPGRHLRWVRYGDQLLLVDIRYGRVVEVVPAPVWY